MKFDLIIFDFDGTLFDTKADITASINFALKQCNVPPASPALVWRFTGDGTPALVKRILGEKNKDFFEIVLKTSLDYYEAHSADFAKPIGDIEWFLEHYKNKTKTILSNKYKSLIDDIIHKFGFEKYFNASFGRDSFAKSKPDPLPLIEIMSMFSVERYQTLYIGDSVNDVLIAKNADVKCFIIPSGASNEIEIEKLKPDLLFRNYRELENIIE